MAGDARRIAILHLDDGIGAAIAGAFQAIIFLRNARLLCKALPKYLTSTTNF